MFQVPAISMWVTKNIVFKKRYSMDLVPYIEEELVGETSVILIFQSSNFLWQAARMCDDLRSRTIPRNFTGLNILLRP